MISKITLRFPWCMQIYQKSQYYSDRECSCVSNAKSAVDISYCDILKSMSLVVSDITCRMRLSF